MSQSFSTASHQSCQNGSHEKWPDSFLSVCTCIFLFTVFIPFLFHILPLPSVYIPSHICYIRTYSYIFLFHINFYIPFSSCSFWDTLLGFSFLFLYMLFFSCYGDLPFIMLYIMQVFCTPRLGFVDSSHSSHPSKIMCSCISYYLFIYYSAIYLFCF